MRSYRLLGIFWLVSIGAASSAHALVRCPEVHLPNLHPASIEEIIQHGVNLICQEQFKGDVCPEAELAQKIGQIEGMRADLPKDGIPVQVGEIVAGDPLGMGFKYSSPVFVRLGPDGYLYLQIGNLSIFSGGFKSAELAFRYRGLDWSEIVRLLPTNPALLKAPALLEPEDLRTERARWKQEQDVSRSILAKFQEQPQATEGLVRIYWVTPEGIYQRKYDHDWFSLTQSSVWEDFTAEDRIDAIRQAATGLSHFHDLADGVYVHLDVKQENYLFLIRALLGGERCLDLVLSDFDLSVNVVEEIAKGEKELVGGGSLEYTDPYRIAHQKWLGSTVRENVQFAQRSDVYSLAFSAAMAFLPFAEATEEANLEADQFWLSDAYGASPLDRAVLTEQYMNARGAEFEADPVKKLLRRALSFDPIDRMSSREFADTLGLVP